MNKTVKETIHAKGIDIGIYTTDFENEYIFLTDIARYRSSDPRITIHTWLRGRDIVEFLGLWESLHNPDFKRSEFDTFKKDSGTNAFTFSIKNWNEVLQGKGIVTKSGRYGGGIFAHSDIALEFASWLSPEFKLYINQPERLELLREAAINQLKTILGLDFSSQKILSISDTSGEEK